MSDTKLEILTVIFGTIALVAATLLIFELSQNRAYYSLSNEVLQVRQQVEKLDKLINTVIDGAGLRIAE